MLDTRSAGGLLLLQDTQVNRMSLDAILWALKDAPVADAEERLILITLAETADDDGCNAYPSTKTIARRALVHQRTVQRRLDALRSRGLIGEGHQSAAAAIPEHRRPVVYDLYIPYSWVSNIARVNDMRIARGRPLLTDTTRPDLHQPPLRTPRTDARKPRGTPGGDYKSPPGTETGGDYKSGEGVTMSRARGDYKSPKSVLEPSPLTSSSRNELCATTSMRGEEEQKTNYSAQDLPDSRIERVLDLAAQTWRFGTRTRSQLRPLVAAALTHHDPQAIAAQLTYNPGGARNTLAVLRARLTDLPEPAAKLLLPAWCGRCDSSEYRWLETTQGLRPCPDCSPQYAVQATSNSELATGHADEQAASTSPTSLAEDA